MKRTLLFVLGGLLLLVVLILGVFRLPATQHWLLQRAVADVPGLTLQVGRVSAGLGEAELRGIELNYEGTLVRLPQLTARYDGWALLTRRELVVSELVATDADVTLAAAPASGPAAPVGSASGVTEQAFAGLLAPLQLPLRATLGGIQVGGRLHVAAQQELTFSAQGQLLQPGATTNLDLALAWSDRAAAALARDLDWVGHLAITAAAGGAVERIELTGTLATGHAKSGQSQQGLATTVVVARAADGVETAEANVRLTTAKPQAPALGQVTVRHRPGDGHVAGEWAVNARREEFAGLVDLEQLPDFTAEAQGAFSFAVATGDFTAEGRATLVGAKLQRLRRELATLGALTAKLDFAVERKGAELRLARLAAAVNDSRGPVLALAVLRPVAYRLDTRAVAFAHPEQDLARLEFSGLPLAWVQPWLADATLGGTVTAGEIRLKGAGSAWTVVTTRPVVFAGVCYGSKGQIPAEQLGGELNLRAGVDGAAWKVEQLDLALRSAAESAPGALKLQLTAQQDAAGRGSLQLPFTLENNGRRSQLALAGEWSLAAGAQSANVRLTGDTIYLRDLAGLAAFLPKAEQPAAAPAPSAKAKTKAKATPVVRPSAKDVQAFWAGAEVRATVDVRRLVLETEEVTGLQATLVCDANQLTVERLVAKAKDAPLDAKLAVTFDAAKPAPYTLQGSCTFPGFDLGAWMRAANPGEDPAIETVLDVTAKLTGQGTNLGNLAANVGGDFVLRGGPGVLRIKDRKVEAASQLGGLVLGLLSKEKQQKSSVVAGSQLLEEMREFRFDRIDISLLRAEDMNLQFRTIDVRSPEKRLSGTGTAQHVVGRTIDEYPLQLELRLAGKEHFAALLEQSRLLDGTKDELGYQCMREPFAVTGTVGEPNWKKMLAQLAAGLVLGK